MISTVRRFVFLYFVLKVVCDSSEVFESVSAAMSGEPKSNCTCGGFSTITPLKDSEPLISQSPGLVVKCDEVGESTCKNLCLALATATKAKGPEILCNKLEDADTLKLSAFYKVCDKPWSYANMTADEPLCCEGKKVKACQSSENATSDIPL